MNDRFKFRFYDNDKKIMIDEDTDSEMLLSEYGKDEWYCCFEAIFPNILDYFDYDEYDKKDFVIMQSTGLEDKNGKLIYEGDIVAHTKTKYTQRYIVNWNNKGFWQLDDNAMARSAKFLEENYEVIGNIYENKSLLESEG